MRVELQLWLVCSSLEHGPWEAYVPWAKSCTLWSTNFHYLIQNSLQLNPTLSRESPGDAHNGYFRDKFNIILPSTLRAVTLTIYIRCLVTNCICSYTFLIYPLNVRQHIKSTSSFYIFCFPCYVSFLSETKYRPYFVKRGQFNISVLQEKQEVAPLYIRKILWEVGYPSNISIVLEDGVTLSPIIEDH